MYLPEGCIEMDHATGLLRPPIQYSVGSLLLITTNVACLTAIGQISDHDFAGCGKLFKAYGVLLTIYGWRFLLIQSNVSARKRWLGLLTIFTCCLPFILLCIGPMFPESLGLPPSKWLGVPIWLFAIPFVSFLIFDFNDSCCTQKVYLVRSTLEILIVFHVWLYAWALIQWSMGWGRF